MLAYLLDDMEKDMTTLTFDEAPTLVLPNRRRSDHYTPPVRIRRATRFVDPYINFVPEQLTRLEIEEADDTTAISWLSGLTAVWLTLLGLYMNQWSIADGRSLTAGIMCSLLFGYGAYASRSKGKHRRSQRLQPKTVTVMCMVGGTFMGALALGFMADNLLTLL